MLRQLAIYHSKDPNNLFCVRIAQGLTHLGKGTLTLCPYHNERQIMSPVAVAGLLSMLVSCLDVKNSELEQACAQMRPGAFKCKCKRRIKCKCSASESNANAQQLKQMQMHLNQMQMHLNKMRINLYQMQTVFYKCVFCVQQVLIC